MSKTDDLKRMMGDRLAVDAAHAGQAIGVQTMTAAKIIAIDRIVADPDQPRRVFDEEELAELAGSLRDHGQTDPVKVRWDAGRDRYVIIDGERRWRAAQRAGITSLSAVVESRHLTTDQITEYQLIENSLRSDLSAIEAGAAYRNLMNVWSVNQVQLAKRLHISESKVSRALAALELPAEVKAAVDAGDVGAVVAVQKHRAKPTTKRASKTSKPTRIVTPAGIVVVMPKPGQTVFDVLMTAAEQLRKKAA
jgi:ParB family chromosome partitioning protein